MSVIVIRYGKVDMCWPRWCNAEEFDDACRQYEEADILPISAKKKEIVTKLQWCFGSRRQAESRCDTVERAKAAVRQIIKEEDCIVVSHGFFMRTFLGQLKKAGYVLEGDRAFGFDNLHMVRAEKQQVEKRCR